MSVIESTLTPAASPTEAEFAGAVVHAIRRYARRAPGGPAAGVDAAVAQLLDRVPGAGRTAGTIARQVDKLPAASRRALLSPGFAELSPAKPLDPRVVAGIVERLGVRKPPAPAPTALKRYEARFSHIVCDDESNPEFLGGDEPYAVFGVVTRDDAAAGNPPRVVTTPVYRKVDDGERRPESGSQNLRLFGPQQLKSDLLITGVMLESDAGAVSEVADALRVVLAAAAALVDEDSFLGALVSAARAAVGLIQSLVADDPIGTAQSIVLSPRDARELTRDAAAVLLPAMRFDGGDANGKYRAFLQLRRA